MSLSDLYGRIPMLEDRSVHFGPPAWKPTCWVARVSFERWPRHYVIERDTRENCVIFYVLQGEGQIDCGTGAGRFCPGDCFCFAPDYPHYVITEADETHIHRLAVAGRGAIRFVEEHLGAVPTVYRPATINEIHAWYDRMLEEATSSRPFCHRMIQHLAPLLLCSIRRGCIESEIPRSADARLWQRAHAWIQQADPATNSVADTADACGCTPEHLSRVFRRYRNTSPLHSLILRRMQQAARLLTTTELPLYAIADACGYADEYVFSKAFKRHFGQPPGRWRRQ